MRWKRVLQFAILASLVTLAPVGRAQSGQDLPSPSAAPSSAGRNAVSWGAAPSEAASSGPTYTQTVQWIEAHVTDTGKPGSTKEDNGLADIGLGCSQSEMQKGDCTPQPGPDVTVSDPVKSIIRFDGCASVTIITTSGVHMDLWTNPPGNPSAWTRKHTDYKETYTLIIPIRSVDVFFSDEVISAHGQQAFADGTPIEPNWLLKTIVPMEYKMGFHLTTEQTPESKRGWDIEGDHSGIVWLVPKDGGVQHHVRTTVAIADPHDYFDQPLPANVPADVLQFSRPGTEAESMHMAKALEHLVQICKDHPEQAPKDLF